jgi:hypothetical protein
MFVLLYYNEALYSNKPRHSIIPIQYSIIEFYISLDLKYLQNMNQSD